MNVQHDEVKNGFIFPKGEKNEAYAQYFIGTSYLQMLSTERIGIGNVTFEPGCRNNWHTHPCGQRLIVAAGVGLTGVWDGPVTDEQYAGK